ncbi:Ribonuclease H domain [Sesbania bispinosa]|nr:Ribonuclease H domain [Sesbania bispinosa]
MGLYGQQCFYLTGNLKEWIYDGIKVNGVVFLTTLWCIWKDRNLFLFEGKNKPVWEIAYVIISLTNVVNKCSLTPNRVREPSVIDGKAGYGGLVRNSKGEWIIGFMGNLDRSDILMAELTAILRGLKLCWEKSFSKVWCMSDSLTAVKLIMGGVPSFHRYANLVHEIRGLLGKNWIISFSHVLREGNGCVDFLAKKGTELNTPHCVLQVIPEEMKQLLQVDVAVSSSCNKNDKDSLLAFSQNITTYPPLNWSSSSDCCHWEGITCDGDSRVTHLLLPSRGLTGFISLSLTSLDSLSHLNLSHNRLTGNLQNQFFSLLNHLLVLDLSYNHLSGELPTFLVDNRSSTSTGVIQEFDLSSNSFNGKIPSSLIQHLSGGGSLVSFNVSNNSFTGQIPTSLFCINDLNSSSIRFLDYSSNHFDGPIQPGLGACSKLEKFRAGFNLLSGPIPSDIFNVVSLTEISLPLNKLTGTIGDGIVSLTNLTVLELYSNHFTGPIPQDIGKLSKLERLLLHVNNLTGLQRLATLDLGNNKFTGVLPPTLYTCKSLAAVRLASNQLEGQISPEILGLKSLSFLSIGTNNMRNITGALRVLTGLKKLSTLMLSKNFLNEMIPNDTNILDPDGFQNLQVLGMGGCNLTGQIPGWLANLKKLEVLDLSFNQISGSIPPWLSTLPQLFYMDLSVNLLTGVFPKELTRLPALTSQQANDKMERAYFELPVFAAANNVSVLQYNQLSKLPPAIYLGTNRLSGRIPIGIGQLKVLHVLDLKKNNFSGNIPVQISNLTNLEKLDLSGNQLSGEIPDSLRRLHFLSYFSVAYNNLQGQIPTGGQFDTFSSSSYEGNPQLCGSVIQRSCFSQQNNNSNSTSASGSSNKKILIRLITGVGFGTAFLIVVLTLWIVSKWKANPRGVPKRIDIVHPEVDKGTSLVMINEGKQDQVFDPLLRGKGFEGEMLQVLDVACMCVSQNPLKRPSIREVVERLRNARSSNQSRYED